MEKIQLVMNVDEIVIPLTKIFVFLPIVQRFIVRCDGSNANEALAEFGKIGSNNAKSIQLYMKSEIILNKLFGFEASKMTIGKELLGGVTTFLTMAYSLALIPSILGVAGMDNGAVFTAFVIATIVSTLLMAVYAKLPFAMASGIGLTNFFAYTVVIAMGYPWQFALTAVFIEGIIFILITLTGLRQKIVEAIPQALLRSISPGIGLFIAFIGLKNAGIVASSSATFVTMGNLHDPAVLMAVFGIVFTGVLLVRNITGALLLGIIATTCLGIPLGITHFQGIFSAPPSLASLAFQFVGWDQLLSLDMVICVLTFLFIDLFDTMGTLMGVCQRAGLVDKDGNVLRLKQAFMADAIGTTVGAMLGTSTVSTYVESASGVDAGGRCGLTSFVTAICFLAAVFLSPLFLSVPTQATAPVLVLVGVMMMNDVRKVDFTDYVKAIPCFLCIVLMPLAFSIAEGILVGLISYVLLHLLCGRRKDVNIGMIILALLFVLKYAFL